MERFCLEVNKSQFVRELRHLCRAEKRAPEISLSFEIDFLTITMGNTSVDVSATGTWPETTILNRKWADGIVKAPHSSAVVTIRRDETHVVVDDGFKVAYQRTPIPVPTVSRR